MHIATVSLKSVSPYCQSRFYQTEKLDKERPDAFEDRTWRDKGHYTQDGKMFIPSFALKNCLADAAKYLSIQIPGKGKATFTKHFDAGVLVVDPIILPVDKDRVDMFELHVPADGKRGGGRRVLKKFPIVREWSGSVAFHILDDVITQDVFTHVLSEAGKFIGIGSFRVRNNGIFGRFSVEKVDWK